MTDPARSRGCVGQVIGGTRLATPSGTGSRRQWSRRPGSRQGVRQGPDYLLHTASGAVGALHEADKALLAEQLPARPVFLDDTVGEKQHPSPLSCSSLMCGAAPPMPTGRVPGLSSVRMTR